MKRRMGPTSNRARYALSVIEPELYQTTIEQAVDQLEPGDRDAVNTAAGQLATYFGMARPDALHVLFRIGVAGR